MHCQGKGILLQTINILLFLLLVACSRQPNHQVQGYIEGRYTYLAAPASGVLKQINVDRGYTVKKGEQLVVLELQPESDIYQAAVENLNQMVAARDAIIANLAYAKITYQRYKILVPKNAIEKAQLDNATAIYQATLAQLAQANANIAASSANLAQTKWTKEQKILYAPIDAVVFDRYYRLGEYTIANQPILSLLAPSDIKAIFFVGQPNLGKLQLNDKVIVQCDGCTKHYTGRISFISPSAEYTPPLIYSNETNEKLIYRVEADFRPADAMHLHPGQPINVAVP